VLLHDSSGREDEVDYIVPAGSVDADTVYEMRTLAGGLICYAMAAEVAKTLGLRFATEYYAAFPELRPLLKTPSYGEPPAFSIWVNRVGVATGIRDEDRAETIRGLHEVALLVLEGRGEEARRRFAEEFMAPGHVPVLVERGLERRRGHTELALALARLAGIPPSMALVEMLARGRQLRVEEAVRLSREYGYPLVEGGEVIEAWRSSSGRREPPP